MLIKAADMENRNLLICEYESADTRDMVTWHMTKAQEIEGVLQLEGNAEDAQWKYDISGLRELKLYLQEERTKEEVCRLLKSIAETMVTVEQYLIPDSRLVLSLSRIYVDEDGYTYMICCPVEKEGANIRNFLRELAGVIRPKSGMTCQYLNRLKAFGAEQGRCDRRSLTMLYQELEAVQEMPLPVPPMPYGGAANSPGVLISQTPPAFGGRFGAAMPTSQVSPAVRDETVVWNNVRGMLVRQRTGERFILNRAEMWMGKDSMNVDIYISDNATISRRHARIVNKNEKYYVCDGSSTNHTYLNGRMLQPNEEMELASGNVIRLSNEEFLFMLV